MYEFDLDSRPSQGCLAKLGGCLSKPVVIAAIIVGIPVVFCGSIPVVSAIIMLVRGH